MLHKIKKSIKIFTIILSGLLIIFFIVLISGYLWLSTKWKDFYTIAEIQTIATQIDSSKALPDNFYKVYDKIYPGKTDRTLLQMYTHTILFILTDNKEVLTNYGNCNSVEVVIFFENKLPKNYKSWSSWIIAHGIEKYASERKCLDYIYQNLKIEDLALKHFSKALNDLTEKEIIELIIRLRAPSYYEKHPESIERIIKAYEEQISITSGFNN